MWGKNTLFCDNWARWPITLSPYDRKYTHNVCLAAYQKALQFKRLHLGNGDYILSFLTVAYLSSICTAHKWSLCECVKAERRLSARTGIYSNRHGHWVPPIMKISEFVPKCGSYLHCFYFPPINQKNLKKLATFWNFKQCCYVICHVFDHC